MTSPRPARTFDWEEAGRAFGETLGGYHAIVVIGNDPVATGRVAIGLAREQAALRHVAVGDLFAESPPIQELVTTDDPHGLVDCFIYGVSLSRIAYEVPGAGQLYVMQSGTEPPDYEEILPHPRWHRLAMGFREVGAMLVLAAPISAPRIEDLVAAFDGAVVVGDSVAGALPLSAVIGSVREPKAADQKPPRVAATAAALPWYRSRMTAVAGAVLTLALAGAALWLAYRPFASTRAGHIGPSPDTTKGIQAVLPATDSASADTLARADDLVALHIANAVDSAAAAMFAVELTAANTQAGAILKLQKDGKNLPAATFAPVLTNTGQWFRVIAGAFTTRTDADTLLAGLRRRRILDPGTGSVVRVPLAFLIDSGVPAAAVLGMVATYADRGQPVYALRQGDGTAWLLAGAFESLNQSTLYAGSLRASGITPVLVYRKGRSF